jgi:hypothetical protein
MMRFALAVSIAFVNVIGECHVREACLSTITSGRESVGGASLILDDTCGVLVYGIRRELAWKRFWLRLPTVVETSCSCGCAAKAHFILDSMMMIRWIKETTVSLLLPVLLLAELEQQTICCNALRS